MVVARIVAGIKCQLVKWRDLWHQAAPGVQVLLDSSSILAAAASRRYLPIYKLAAAQLRRCFVHSCIHFTHWWHSCCTPDFCRELDETALAAPVEVHQEVVSGHI